MIKKYYELFRHYYLWGLLIIPVLIVFIYLNNTNTIEPKTIPLVEETVPVISEIVVDIKGSVNTPGIYKLAPGSRLIDQTTPIMIQRLSHLFARKPLFLMEI